MPTKKTVNIKYFELTKSLDNKKSIINDKVLTYLDLFH